jgi:hypothetical protein
MDLRTMTLSLTVHLPTITGKHPVEGRSLDFTARLTWEDAQTTYLRINSVLRFVRPLVTVGLYQSEVDARWNAEHLPAA